MSKPGTGQEQREECRSERTGWKAEPLGCQEDEKAPTRRPRGGAPEAEEDGMWLLEGALTVC
jgi:hypothetical protein